jgi:hypothetical protein
MWVYFMGCFVYLTAIWYFFGGRLVYFVVIWYIFLVLVFCSKKNLATLARQRKQNFDYFSLLKNLHYLFLRCDEKNITRLLTAIKTKKKSFGSLQQGCQMVYFQAKNPDLGTFWRVLQWKRLVYFMAILVYFTDISYNVLPFGIFVG